MSEESLRHFLVRLANDKAFVGQLKANPQEALRGFDLSATERVALGTNDEDGLRRLAGQDVAGFMAGSLSIDNCLQLTHYVLCRLN